MFSNRFINKLFPGVRCYRSCFLKSGYQPHFEPRIWRTKRYDPPCLARAYTPASLRFLMITAHKPPHRGKAVASGRSMQ